MESRDKYNLDDSFFKVEGNILIRQYDCEKLYIESWRENSFRIHSTKQAKFLDNDSESIITKRY